MSRPVQIPVEVACALPETQQVVALEVPAGTTAREAVRLAGLEGCYPGIDPASLRIGIFSRVIEDPSSYQLAAGDRVEIYRPLQMDPKESRRLRAEKARRKPR